MIAINLTGVWLCMKAEIEQMLKQGEGGAIVNTSSGAGLAGSKECRRMLRRSTALPASLGPLRSNTAAKISH